ncbi:GTP pyrophosphokinase [Caminicella sporogenes DSM 14501]|uniref:GTP diphosphokinase n=1 Tax=Caminicella sporogenes DSM 14501 TaxID=1121266 RepID=A0A1M6M122_9FIRM|nr:bifunctional (p)ppGpp synthetase/guanosine-3',5'-bis(diphosphate) 3'-pyrophosphohydrolase [Caminicella sporogenes]RKD28018.1 (p)ppGpp synthetase [Caminicella sporogenes]WIF94374.1 bifunctional (p)ppGpp synthetase/guanosine-3',5'-bis(diphosphate) 3'-pyrophosphohydrolase [Caminicella sporogenes]SHJ77003.1 GTP pyrophosphokinase [Caminicella sporogenes DSM 14501]
MLLETFIEKIRQYNPQYDLSRIIKAYNFAENAHEGQYRKSGEKYFIHPINVALILAELELDESTVIAGLLHDVIEDTKYTFDDIKREFGEEIALLVDGVTKLGKLTYETKEERQAENLRKMFLAMAKDIRVILIKLADRLHNMRTLKYMDENKKKEKAMETLEIYAPIAHRLGIFKIKWEFEDLCLRYLDPDAYYDLVEKVAKKRREREEYINLVIKKLKENLDSLDINYEIYGRPKHFYSIYKKMVYQHKSFEEIYDLTAVRVIVDNVKDCYGVLGIVHTMWKPIPGRFKDYIAMPKPNMYQSLHTTVIGPKGEPLEIQIRTWEMHRIAEYGIAAHWKYKEGKVEEGELDKKLTWLRQLLEWQRDLKDPKEFMETLKIDLFTNQVFVFTPKGDVIELPFGSTPVDFAYKIHSAVGNSCIGAKVDGRIVPLDYKLKTGNIVEILTSSHSNGPSRDWLKFVKSTNAKNRIKQWFKKERKEENIERGKELLEKEIKKQGFNPKELLRAEWLNLIVKKIKLNSIEDLYAAIGYGGIALNQVIPKLKEKYKEEQKENKQLDENKQLQSKVSKSKLNKTAKQGVKVKGIDNILVRFAKCCTPVPGDEIIGFITRGRGITVHRKDCPNILNGVDTDRLIEVQWDTDKKISYQTEIQVIAPDRKGLLSEITNIISEAKLHVTAVNAKTTKEKLAIINLTIEISNTDQLLKVMNKFRTMQGIIDVKRVTS